MNTPESHKRYINQGTVSRICANCGGSMTQSKGRIVEILDKDKRDPTAQVIKSYKLNDQRVIYHGHCRTEGRAKARAQERLMKDINSQVS